MKHNKLNLTNKTNNTVSALSRNSALGITLCACLSWASSSMAMQEQSNNEANLQKTMISFQSHANTEKMGGLQDQVLSLDDTLPHVDTQTLQNNITELELSMSQLKLVEKVLQQDKVILEESK